MKLQNFLLARAAAITLAAAGCVPAAGVNAQALPAAAPNIDSLLAQITPADIERRVDKLVSFGTRHTLSDTVSESRGIGAARRWIERDLQRCAAMSQGRMTVTLDSHISAASARIAQPVEIVNVVATLKGTAMPERVIVVSGHYDSRASDVLDATSDAPGANDDASGAAAVMAMACAFAPHSFPATLVFMNVAAEEQGLLGAEHYAQRARQERRNIIAMVTNDIIGSPIGDQGQRDAMQVRLFADGFSPLLKMVLDAQKLPLPAAPLVPTPDTGTSTGTGKSATTKTNTGNTVAPALEAASDTDTLKADARKTLEIMARTGGDDDTPTSQLGRYLKEAGERYQNGVTVRLISRRDRFLRGGDHLPFLERGYAAVRFTEPFENFAHQHQNVRTEGAVQYGDLPQFVDYAYVARVARINAAGLASLALAPAAPASVGLEVAGLTNDTRLVWTQTEREGVVGYRIVWREPGAPLWQHHQDVGDVLSFTLLGVSKDNYVFAVASRNASGQTSLPGFAQPIR